MYNNNNNLKIVQNPFQYERHIIPIGHWKQKLLCIN